MDNNLHRETVKALTKPVFGAKKSLISKTTPIFPRTAEREYIRLSNAYMKILNEEVKNALPELMAIYKRTKNAPHIMRVEMNAVYEKVAEKVEHRVAKFDVKKKITGISTMVKNTCLNQWKNAVKRTTNQTLMDEYYSKEFYQSTVQPWIDTNTMLLIPALVLCLSRIKDAMYESCTNKDPMRQVAKSIQRVYNKAKREAKFVAIDQIGNLNSQISKLQYQDAGCNYYIWSTKGDNRVRPDHQSLEGKMFSWDSPPLIGNTGRRCHPGEDYRCRCVAIPVFDFLTINLPIIGAVHER